MNFMVYGGVRRKIRSYSCNLLGFAMTVGSLGREKKKLEEVPIKKVSFSVSDSAIDDSSTILTLTLNFLGLLALDFLDLF